MAQKTFREEYESIGTFLVLEILALVSFGLGGVSLIFQYAGFIVALIATFFAFKNYSKDDLVPVLCLGAPLLLLSVFTGFGYSFSNGDILAKLGCFLALISFLAIGLSARRMKSFSTRNTLYCIGGGLALLTLIGTIATWAQYGVFYPLIHAKAGSYYYDGNLYSILNEMAWLQGFKVVEVSQNYGGLFALMSACFLPASLFVKYKEDKIMFIVFAVIGGIGLISIISIPNFYALIFFVIAFGAALFYRFLRNNELAIKILKYAILIIVGFAGVLVIIALLNASNSNVSNFIAGSSFLNRIFNGNRIMIVANPVIAAALRVENLFGLNHIISGYDIPMDAIRTSSGAFEIEIIKEGGIIAFLLFVIFALFAYESFSRYLKSSKDADYVKVIFLTLIVGFVFYSTLCSDVFPVTHDSGVYLPFTTSLPLFIIIFVIGFTALPKGKENVSYQKEVKKEEPQINVEDEYTFIDVEEEEM